MPHDVKVNAATRIDEFKAAVLKWAKRPAHTSASYGLSNNARFIEGGILLGVPNLEGFSQQAESFICFSRIFLTPTAEIHFATLLEGERILTFRQRLDQMATAAAGGDESYSARNNNVSLYLGPNAQMYLSNKKVTAPTLAEAAKQELGPAITIDEVYYAVYDSSTSASINLVAEQTVEAFNNLVGENKVRSLPLWSSQADLAPATCRMPGVLGMPEIKAGIAKLGGHYAEHLVEDLHHGLNFLPDKHFVILTGISGTGKTSLIRRYAYTVHGLTDLAVDNSLYFKIPVRPEWTDPTALLGFQDPFTGKYVIPSFLQAILTANRFQQSPVFVCLDEMNIARVEHYFADILSAMEDRAPLKIHTNQGLLKSDLGPEVSSAVPWPKNLFIIGTVNIDESTYPISDKVLDRAIVIDMSDVDLEGYLDRLQEANPSLTDAAKQCRSILLRLSAALKPYTMNFGYRTVSEMLSYHKLACNGDASRSPAVIDAQILEKVLVKLKGGDRESPLLEELAGIVKDYSRSSAKVHNLQRDLEQYGSFQANK